MVDSSPSSSPAVQLECVSWLLVQHHREHGALRFTAAADAYLATVAPNDRMSRFCLATGRDDPIAVVGLLHYRQGADDLHFIRLIVNDECRGSDLGRRMITEVVTHPTCMHLSRIYWPVSAADSDDPVHHLERLRDFGQRLCGTTFKLLIGEPGNSRSPEA